MKVLNRHWQTYSKNSLVKSVCTANIPVYKSERSSIQPRSEEKENAQDRLFSYLLTPSRQQAVPAVDCWIHVTLHCGDTRWAGDRVQHGSLLHVVSDSHHKIQKKQNLINSAICPRYNPISTTAVHSKCILCLRGRCLLQIKKRIVLLHWKTSNLLYHVKRPLDWTADAGNETERASRLSVVANRNTPKSERERNGDSDTFVCLSFEVAALLQFHCICSFHIHWDHYSPCRDLREFAWLHPSCGLLRSCSRRGQLTQSYVSPDLCRSSS